MKGSAGCCSWTAVAELAPALEQWLLGWAQVRLNFPNGDMVGHTGDLKATITACTAVDTAVTVRGFAECMT